MKMIIGVPKEKKDNENRVALTPAGTKTLVQRGHQVVIENNAGAGSGFPDYFYIDAGAKMVATARKVYDEADLIVKVKEPLSTEYNRLKRGQILFTFLHLAAAAELTQLLLQKKVTAIAYETVQLDDGSLPLLAPMSVIAGKMAVQIGAHLLEKRDGGMGVLLGAMPGVEAGRVVILGAGTVGSHAARTAVGIGARVTILDRDAGRLHQLRKTCSRELTTLMSNTSNIAEAVKGAELLISAVLVAGAKCPTLVTDEMVKTMKPGAVIIDVAVDQGGSVETIDRETTHSNPVYERHGVLHYAVPNIPGLVPRTATLALTNATLPLILQLADKGLVQAIQDNAALARGISTIGGHCTSEAVANALSLAYQPLTAVSKLDST